MKKVILSLLLSLGSVQFYACAQAPSQTADTYIRPYNEDFQYGTNIGYFGSHWTDSALAGIAQAAGVHSLRPTLPEHFLDQYGYNIRDNEFNAYVNTLGMKELTCFVEGPSAAHRDMTVYPGGSGSSHLFAHLYEPIWNPDGTVNQNNYYAYYLYRLLQVYGNRVRFWEIINEPDYTYTGSQAHWATVDPTPAELPNIQAPLSHYVRTLRISYEVIKRYHPEAYVTTGGIGHSEFLQALLRNTDNPNGGTMTAQYPRRAGAYFDVLSYHSYPNYSLHFWNNVKNGFDYTRTSDYAADKLMQDHQDMQTVLRRAGYDGVTHPLKYEIVTETNVSRRTSDDRTGNEEYQRSFGIKALVLAQKNGIRQLYYYGLGEQVNAPPAWQSVSWSDELALMGLYENLNRDGPGQQRRTQLGDAFATTSQLLYGYNYDAARTAALALPAGTAGAAFSQNGEYRYVLWAKALTDNSEYAQATYSFPAAWGLSTLRRHEWNYAVTGTQQIQLAQGITLSSSPAFFTENTRTTGAVGVGCAGAGTIAREQWNNVGGSTVAGQPGTASSTEILGQFEAVSSTEYNYASRIRGYICPPASGSYTFYVNGNDAAELYLSPDDNPANKVRIASCAGWTSGPHDFTRYASQQSAPVPLVAGQRYYVEALHQQSWGPGSVSVAWLRPDGTHNEPIPGSVLVPYGTAAPGVVLPPVVVPPVVAPPVVAGCTNLGTLSREQWNNVGGSTVQAQTGPASSGSLLPRFEAVAQNEFNYAARLQGYICPPASGSYTFYVNGDDAAELYLSPDDNPANKVRIASCAGWTSGPHDFTRYASQQSAPVPLVAGQRYYVEALHQQGWGPGSVSVAWLRPDGTRNEPIPGSVLMPFGASNTGSVPVVTPPVVAGCANLGTLSREQWNNVGGSTVRAQTGSASYSAALFQFEAVAQNEFNYASRIRGYICPPASGSYTFYVNGDDAAELYLSPDDNPANKVRIASCAGWTSGPHDFTRYASQQSAPVPLVAGQRYYVEALHQQSWGPGSVSVAWLRPDGTRNEPIPGANLMPFGATAARGAAGPAGTASAAGEAATARSSSAGPGTAAGQSTLHVYPNPFSQRATVQFIAVETGPATLALYNLKGQLVRELFAGPAEAGAVRSVPIEVPRLSTGLYVLRLTTKNAIFNKKVSCGGDL